MARSQSSCLTAKSQIISIKDILYSMSFLLYVYTTFIVRMVCGCVRTKPHLGRNNNNNREHETLNLRVVDPSPTQYVIKPHAVA